MLKLHLRRYRGSMLLSVLLFVIGLFLGVLNIDLLQSIIAGEVDKLRQISSSLGESEHPELQFFIFIFLNNVIKSVLVIWLGVFFGIIPLFFVLLNGMALGFVVAVSGAAGANIGELVLKGLLPHGIIEIPALLIACAYGLKFGGLVWKSILPGLRRSSYERSSEWKNFFKAAFGATIWIILLLVVAALIESTLTYHLVQK